MHLRTIYLLPIFLFDIVFSAQGIHYYCLDHSNSSYLNEWLAGGKVHVMEVDPSLCEIRPVSAVDNGIGRESVLSISDRYNAHGAINAGFFAIGGTFDGNSRGALKIDRWIGFPFKPRGCIGWSKKEQIPQMDRLWVSAFVKDKHRYELLNGLNRDRKQGEAILFNSAFHRTTLTKGDGQELIIKDGVVSDIRSEAGSTTIPENGYVLSIQEEHPLFNAFDIGAALSFHVKVTPLTGRTSAEEWRSFDYIVGGTPLLLHKGEPLTDYSSERTILSFLTKKHARTAVGLLPNGHWLFVVVDRGLLQGGMTIEELSSFMKQMGCTHALNMDGGGSSTMVHEGSIRNQPLGDEDEQQGHQSRRVSSAIIIRSKQS